MEAQDVPSGEAWRSFCSRLAELGDRLLGDDFPGSDRVGVQNKHTGYMAGHDRHAENQPVRQYSSGRQDGSGTYVLVRA